MTTTLFGISFDAHDAAGQAEFWAQALHRKVNDGATARSAAVAPGDDPAGGPLLMFHQVPEDKTVKNRVHLDLIAADLHNEAQRLIGLGATQVRSLQDNNGGWIDFIDPEGNEFDVVAG
ncbi:glyoxalase/bleomycin resistance/dioxygenase family protein [Nocardia sp. CA2R105]|nr:glyoxalase/bleomycin resistance/dioxygenase family protein [Nocardia coffeae]